MNPQPNFSPQLETDIERLRKRIEQIPVSPEMEARKTELVREEIKEFIEEVQEAVSPIPTQPIREKVTGIQKLEPSQQVGALLSLVFERGLHEAISVVKNLDDPAIVDEFHDTLVDSFFDLLVQRGIVTLV